MLTQSKQAPYLICHAPGKTILARWQQDRPAIQAALAGLAGAGGISLSPWFNHPDPDQGIPTNFDFAPVLQAIKAAGFGWVQVAPQFYADLDPRLHGMDVFQANWNVIAALYESLDASGLEFLIDCCAEFNSDYATNPGFAQYVRTLWIDFTTAFAPGGVPCWRGSISFTPSISEVELFSVFSGNWPAILLPHIYSNEQTLSRVIRDLPPRPCILGETDMLQTGDESIPQAILGNVVLDGALLMRVCPWPWCPRTPNEVMIDPALCPPIVSRPWLDIGA